MGRKSLIKKIVTCLLASSVVFGCMNVALAADQTTNQSPAAASAHNANISYSDDNIVITNDDNVYIVSPSGAQMINNVEINVGSLYASNNRFAEKNINKVHDDSKVIVETNVEKLAELMNLGNVTTNKATFEGDRVFLNVNR